MDSKINPAVSGYSRKTYIDALKRLSSGVVDITEYDKFILRDLMIMGYIDGKTEGDRDVVSVQRININGVLFLNQLEKAERETSLLWGSLKILKWLCSLIGAAAVGYIVKENLGG